MKAEEYLQKAYRSIYENDFEQAMHWFEQALISNPDHSEIHYRYSITCARSNRLDKAVTHARLATILAPGHEEYVLHFNRLQSIELTSMAKKHLESLDQEAEANAEPAARLLERASVLDPLSVETQVLLAICYGEMKDYERAIQAIQEASMLPLDASVARELQELKQRMKNLIDQSSS